MKDFLRWAWPRAAGTVIAALLLLAALLFSVKRYNYCRSLGHPAYYCVGR